ncbi:MAG: pilus assembly protein [Kiritimatiellae bacterium]|nr:pilus assembly protein [Kiritimatiellia bacterium]
MRRGQAMVETVVAVVFLSFAFLALVQLSQMLQARILLDHAAARAARARAVGFNEYMCRKVARAAVIPIAGECLWPLGLDDGWSEAARVPAYLASPDEPHARGVLDYALWHRMSVDLDAGLGSKVDADLRLHTDDFTADGHAAVESHYPLYMERTRE